MVRRVVMGLVVTCAALCFVVPAFAQGGRGGRGGPPGGFGGGGGPGGMMFLLQDENVRKELEIVDDQVEKMREIGRKMFDGMREQFSGLRDLSEDERAKKMEEIREQMTARQEEIQKEMDEVLLPHQRERLKQIVVQNQLRRGGTGNALTNGPLAEQLGITEAQKEELTKAAEEAEKELAEKTAKLREELKNKVLKVLTAEQRAKLDEMMGKPIEFAPPQFGRGGPGGGGPGGRGGPGGGPGGRPDDGN